MRSIQLVKEQTQDAWNWHLATEFCRDVSLGFRALRRDLSFAVSVVAILSLGVGATVTMFSVLKSVVLRPLPYARAAELTRVSTPLIQENEVVGTSVTTYRAAR